MTPSERLCMSIIFNSSLIALNVVCQTPEQVIEKSGQLLFDAKLCSADYITAMKQVYHEYGAYIVLDHGIAMPHARPDCGVLANGFSIMTLAQPVSFGHPEFDPVHVVISIASQQSSSHLTMIQLIANLIEQGIVNVAMQATTQKCLFDFIHPLITEEK